MEAALNARRVRRRIAFAVTAIAVLTIAGGSALWWARHPTLFADNGGTETGPAEVGQPVWVGLTFPEDGHAPIRLHLESVHVRVVSDSSEASLSAFVCETPRQAVGGTAMGMGDSAMNRRVCLHPVPARNVTMTLGNRYRQYIDLEIVPTKPGTLRIDRLDLTYSHGLQEGTQTIDLGLTINTRR